MAGASGWVGVDALFATAFCCMYVNVVWIPYLHVFTLNIFADAYGFIWYIGYRMYIVSVFVRSLLEVLQVHATLHIKLHSITRCVSFNSRWHFDILVLKISCLISQLHPFAIMNFVYFVTCLGLFRKDRKCMEMHPCRQPSFKRALKRAGASATFGLWCGCESPGRGFACQSIARGIRESPLGLDKGSSTQSKRSEMCWLTQIMHFFIVVLSSMPCPMNVRVKSPNPQCACLNLLRSDAFRRVDRFSSKWIFKGVQLICSNCSFLRFWIIPGPSRPTVSK